jgi:hypothetical protein
MMEYMMDESEREQKLRDAQSILLDASHLVHLIEVAANQISETCADERDGVVEALHCGASIRSTASTAAEKMDEAAELLLKIGTPLLRDKKYV